MSKSQPSHIWFTLVVLVTCCVVWGCGNGSKKEPSPFPGKAMNPQPAQNAFDVPVTTNLTWSAAVQAESYDVYFGTGSVAVESADNSSAEFKGNQTDVTYDPPGDLSYTTTYYWRIDPINAFGTTKGDLWFFTTELTGNVICVDDTGGDNSNDGLSWTTAVKTIQKGLDLAGASGWSVLVAAGTYKGAGNKALDFNGKATGLKGVGGPSNCIIDCQNDGRAFYFHSGETSSAVVEGFCIQYGKVVDANGGGICCDNSSSPTIRNCTIQFCKAERQSVYTSGGGIYCLDSAPTIALSAITSNRASSGGGIYSEISNPEVRNCSIENNEAIHRDGGGIYSYRSNLTVEDCIMAGNSAPIEFGDGGALYIQENDSSAITRCRIENNSAESGGGIYYHTPNSNATITNSSVEGNRARTEGGGIYCDGCDLQVTNCLIASNSAYSVNARGGGFHCRGSNPILTNCTIAHNYAGELGGGIHCFSRNPTINNCVVVSNRADFSGNQIYVHSTYTVALNYCCFSVGAGDVSGAGFITEDTCIHLDPLFVNASAGDYHLQNTSPCTDAGLNSAISGYSTDLDGNPRIVNGVVDIGAYEKQ